MASDVAPGAPAAGALERGRAPRRHQRRSQHDDEEGVCRLTLAAVRISEHVSICRTVAIAAEWADHAYSHSFADKWLALQ